MNAVPVREPMHEHSRTSDISGGHGTACHQISHAPSAVELETSLHISGDWSELNLAELWLTPFARVLDSSLAAASTRELPAADRFYSQADTHIETSVLAERCPQPPSPCLLRPLAPPLILPPSPNILSTLSLTVLYLDYAVRPCSRCSLNSGQPRHGKHAFRAQF